MHAPSLNVLGVVVAHPTTCLTNLLLAVECLAFAWWLRPPGRAFLGIRTGLVGEKGNPWATFFLLLSLGMALGAAKHGIAHLLADGLRGAVTVSSGLAGMTALLVAERVVLGASGLDERVDLALRQTALAKFLLFAFLHLMDWSFLVVAANAAIALPFLLAASFRAFRAGRLGFDRISLGWGALILAAVPYLLETDLSPWFDHVDMAHMGMMAGLALVFQGARVPPGVGANVRSESAAVPSPSPKEVEPWAS